MINFFFLFQGYSDQFDKYSWRTIDHLGVSYDYQSIMHYDRLAFTKNGEPTIVATGNENMEFGTPSKKLSSRDIFEINALYDCRASEYALFDIVFLKESVKGTVIIYRLLGEEGGWG